MSSAPSTPAGKSRWGRMGGVMRRASTVLAISRPGTPSEGVGRDSDSVSLRRSTSREIVPQPITLSPPPPGVQQKLPTPIAESPAREAAATTEPEPAVGPSPLAQQTVAPVVTEEPVEMAAPPPAKAPEEEQTSPTGYIPPPVIDSTAGNPGAFTDITESLPQADVVKDPFAPSPPSQPAPVAEVAQVVEELPVAPVAEAREVVDEVPAASTPEVAPVAEVVPAVEPSVPVEVPLPLAESPAPIKEEDAPEPVQPTEASHSYFDKPIVESILDFEVEPSVAEPVADQGEAAQYNSGPGMPVAEPSVEVEPPTDLSRQEPSVPTFVPDHPPEPEPVTPIHDEAAVPVPEVVHEAEDTAQSQPEPERQVVAEILAPTPTVPVYHDSLPSYMTMDDGHAVWGGDVMQSQPVQQAPDFPQPQQHEDAPPARSSVTPIPIPVVHEAESISRQSSIEMPNPHPEPEYTDPFADPIPAIVATDTTLGDAVHEPLIPETHPQMPVPSHEDVKGTIVMPLPPFNEVIPSSERLPLLSRPVSPSKKVHSHNGGAHTHLHTSGAFTPANHASISPLAAPSTSWDLINSSKRNYGACDQLKLHELGWLEYSLPDGTVYYVHPTRKVTTDVNLRSETLLEAVELWLDERKGRDGDNENLAGIEAWLREVKNVGKKKTGGVQVQAPVRKSGASGKGKGGSLTFYFERYWVDHNVRTVVKDDAEDHHLHTVGHVHGKGKKHTSSSSKATHEDQLDLEYRFWSFMEVYPAHCSLPINSKKEAMDILTWAWTDRLLPSAARAIPSPFKQEECQELMNLLKSFGHDHHGDNGIQTRVVARILLRVAQWRQTYFRPNKPLPTDVSKGPQLAPPPRRPFTRALFDFVVSCLCLGIPYLFIERARLSARIDEESGMMRSASPMVLIGACTCLVAAIVLSASVTFLSLPGLDSWARTAGMVAVLFATFTMVATAVAVLRHKADLERPPSVGIEGFMIISRRSVAISLPVVFLAYSIIAFITAIVLYTLRGAAVTDPSSHKHAFEDYTRWTVVGLVGTLAGIVTISMIIFRK
ncbi:hypothetical protein JR316_0004203 [Psilocybe cubensis]|uniref:Uncharacterized protein n=1 Tax=Psilocybe cubensis TaxID=181762 RepID=A0ACB8H2H9_PSICU|nr:hypothetical protein JR316_0004203 [Psilocybe cubensis]KAH9482108.1 hypothetical protein JR316_0004203 [Psilocybe cubensis]